jgi:hypothetical protein
LSSCAIFEPAQTVPPLDKIQNRAELDRALTALAAALFDTAGANQLPPTMAPVPSFAGAGIFEEWCSLDLCLCFCGDHLSAVLVCVRDPSLRLKAAPVRIAPTR